MTIHAPTPIQPQISEPDRCRTLDRVEWADTSWGKIALIARLTFFTVFALSLGSCNGGKESQDAKGAEAVPGVGLVSDFPSQNLVASEKVFPEEVLESWGYVTTEVAEGYHAIRSSENYGDSDEAMYARFRLAKAVFDNATEAAETRDRIEALLETDAGFKDYTQIVQQGSVLYSISATSNYTFLSHQPKLMERARVHLVE